MMADAPGARPSVKSGLKIRRERPFFAGMSPESPYTDSWTHAEGAEAPVPSASDAHDPDVHSERKLLKKITLCGTQVPTLPEADADDEFTRVPACELHTVAPPSSVRPAVLVQATDSEAPQATVSDAPPTVSEPPMGASERPAVASLVPKKGRLGAVISLLVAANVALGAGMFGLWHQHREQVAPVATMSADVAQLKADQAGTKDKLESVQAKVEKHEAAIARTNTKVDQIAEDQRAVEQDLCDHEAREAREMAALQTRMKHVERGVVDGAYALSLKEAVKVIDSVRPPPQKLAPHDAHGTVASR